MLADIVAQKESPYFYQNQKQTNKNWEARNNPHNLLVSTCQLCWFSPYTCLSTLVPLTVFPLPPANSVLPWPQVLSAQALLSSALTSTLPQWGQTLPYDPQPLAEFVYSTVWVLKTSLLCLSLLHAPQLYPHPGGSPAVTILCPNLATTHHSFRAPAKSG